MDREPATGFVREALLAAATAGGMQCGVCARRCQIGEGERGWCKTREVRNGRLVALNYGAVSTAAADPIEKKPLFHFLPGTLVMTFGGWSCNFACPWCQNWEISKSPPPGEGWFVAPGEAVELALEHGCRSIALSYNEPTLQLEWAVDVFRAAAGEGLKCCFVTNGFMTGEALRLLRDGGLEAMNVDVKGAAQTLRECCGAAAEAVHDTCRTALALGIHLELTTLLIPGVNDSKEEIRGLVRRVGSDLGGEIPWHFTAYHPSYRWHAPPTPPALLGMAREIALAEGMKHVYTGNIGWMEHGETGCPECGRVVIARRGFHVLRNTLAGGRCPECGRRVYGVWDGSG